MNDRKADSSCRSDDDWSRRRRRSADDYAGWRNAGYPGNPGTTGDSRHPRGSLDRGFCYSGDTCDGRRSGDGRCGCAERYRSD